MSLMWVALAPASAQTAVHDDCEAHLAPSGAGPGCTCLFQIGPTWWSMVPYPSPLDPDETGTCWDVRAKTAAITDIPFRNELRKLLHDKARDYADNRSYCFHDWLDDLIHPDALMTGACMSDIGGDDEIDPDFRISVVNNTLRIEDPFGNQTYAVLNWTVPMVVEALSVDAYDKWNADIVLVLSNGALWRLPGPHQGGPWWPAPPIPGP